MPYFSYMFLLSCVVPAQKIPIENLYISKVGQQCRRPYFELGKPVVQLLKRGITATGRSYNLKEKQNENHRNFVVAEG